MDSQGLYSATMTLQLRSPSRQPSQELLDLMREVGRFGTKPSELFEGMLKQFLAIYNYVTISTMA
jgi:hypothetical protein